MPKYSPMPSRERLQEVFAFNDQGVLIWKAKPYYCSKIAIGSPAGTRRKDGYIKVRLDKKFYFVHRIAWYLSTGIEPGNLQIDHINRIKWDNRPSNLRLATNYENAQNRLEPARGATGELCVTFSRSKLKPYLLQIKNKYIGIYKTLEEACQARDDCINRMRSEFSAR
jgi:hypothetical protein